MQGSQIQRVRGFGMLDIYGEIRMAMRRDLDAAQSHGISAEIIGDHFGLSKWSVYKWIEGTSRPDLRVILAWPALTGEMEVARTIARHWGLSGAQRGIPDVRRVETRALPATISECADVFRVTGEALRDGKITALEAQRIHREVVEAHVALDELDEDVRASVTSDGRASSLAEASDV